MEDLRGQDVGLRFSGPALRRPLRKADAFEHRQQEQQSSRRGRRAFGKLPRRCERVRRVDGGSIARGAVCSAAHRVNQESSPGASRQAVLPQLRRDLSRLSRRPAGRVVGIAARSHVRWSRVARQALEFRVRGAPARPRPVRRTTAADALSAVLFDGEAIADGRCGGRPLARLVINSTKTTRSSNSSFRWPRSDTRCGPAGAVRACSDRGVVVRCQRLFPPHGRRDGADPGRTHQRAAVAGPQRCNQLRTVSGANERRRPGRQRGRRFLHRPRPPTRSP